MPRDTVEAPSTQFPDQGQPDRAAAAQSLELLDNWRTAGAATAIVMGGLLPFAAAWHTGYLAMIVASTVLAVILAFGCHLIREQRLATLAIFPALAQLPSVAGKHQRLLSARNRRALAEWLRQTAAPMQPSRRFDCCPVLSDRVAPVRFELLQIASALERTEDHDPVCVALIRELLTDGCSPLYNPKCPADDLTTTIARARAGIPAANPPA